ncbi:hypothetical protein, partial [Proteus mirabilis]|uniref:hypothetical protein n=1 Tax=Proteus mirabilis TaxID=584 RepID=UPI001C893360
MYKVKNHTTPGYSTTGLIASTSFWSAAPSSGESQCFQLNLLDSNLAFISDFLIKQQNKFGY